MLKDLGLCVTLYDVRSVEGGFVFPGDGAPRFTVCVVYSLPRRFLTALKLRTVVISCCGYYSNLGQLPFLGCQGGLYESALDRLTLIARESSRRRLNSFHLFSVLLGKVYVMRIAHKSSGEFDIELMD